ESSNHRSSSLGPAFRLHSCPANLPDFVLIRVSAYLANSRLGVRSSCQIAAELRVDLKRLKRDTDLGRTVRRSAGKPLKSILAPKTELQFVSSRHEPPSVPCNQLTPLIAFGQLLEGLVVGVLLPT